MSNVKINQKYNVITTDSGDWIHAPSSDFLFAFIQKDWDSDTKTAVTDAFKKALLMSSSIKQAVLKTSGQTVVNGLYTLDQKAMTTAMNSIDGMGMTAASQQRKSGSGTAVNINQEFFGSILAGLGGDVAPLLDYLTKEMGDLQAEVKSSNEKGDFGTIVGMISLMPDLGIPVTTFRYAFSSQQTKAWMVNIVCVSVEHYSYDYSYTTVDYNYNDLNARDEGRNGSLMTQIVKSHQALSEAHKGIVNHLISSPKPQPNPIVSLNSGDHASCISEGIALDQSKEAGTLGLIKGKVTVQCLIGLGFVYMIASGIRLRITNSTRKNGKTVFDFSYDGRESQSAVIEAFEKGKGIIFSKD